VGFSGVVRDLGLPAEHLDQFVGFGFAYAGAKFRVAERSGEFLKK
jgi:hypothetical protein